jgi:hypothetical protein
MLLTIESCLCLGITASASRKDGKTYESVHLFVEGKDGGELRVHLSPTALELRSQVLALRLKQVRARVEIREFRGTLFLDLFSLDAILESEAVGLDATRPQVGQS